MASRRPDGEPGGRTISVFRRGRQTGLSGKQPGCHVTHTEHDTQAENNRSQPKPWESGVTVLKR